MSRLDAFQSIFRMPDEMLPHTDLVATEREIDLIIGLGVQAMTMGQIAEMMELGGAETAQFLLSAEQRCVIQRHVRNGETTYSASSFYRRLTYLSMQEYDGWRAVPERTREKLLHWHLEENILHHDLVRRVGVLKQNPDAVTIHNRDILLLEEALALVDAAELHVVVPCDCRTTVIACDHPRWNTCLRLDDRGRRTLEQGEGQIVSKQECREIVLKAHESGLFHTGQKGKDGRPAILNGNCCACCSYPIRGGIALGMAKQWPKSHYVASIDWEKCDHCGVCIERCPFEAFYHDGAPISMQGKNKQQVRFDPEKCFGCGICTSTCSQVAITMFPLGECSTELM